MNIDNLEVLHLEVLILECTPVDGLPASAIPMRDIAALCHEPRDDTVEGRALKSERLLARTRTRYRAIAEGSEILRCARDNVPEELHLESADLALSNSQIEEHTRSGRHLD